MNLSSFQSLRNVRGQKREWKMDIRVEWTKLSIADEQQIEKDKNTKLPLKFTLFGI